MEDQFFPFHCSYDNEDSRIRKLIDKLGAHKGYVIYHFITDILLRHNFVWKYDYIIIGVQKEFPHFTKEDIESVIYDFDLFEIIKDNVKIPEPVIEAFCVEVDYND